MIVTNRQIHIENKQISDGELMGNDVDVGCQLLLISPETDLFIPTSYNHLHHHPRHSRPL